MAEKRFVLDTNVLVYDPESIFAFKQAFVVIPATVLEELDQFKGETSDRGRNAREAIRHLDSLRSQGPLKDGIHLKNGGMLQVVFSTNGTVINVPFESKSEDNEILRTALRLKDKGYHVVFISKDLNLRVKADVLGIEAEDYIKDEITKDRFYKGWTRIQVPAVQLKREFPEELQQLVDDKLIIPNEYVLVESNHNPHNYKVFRYLGSSKFVLVTNPRFRWPLEPRNPQQLMALDLLLNDDIKLVTLFGPAGTGKTFLAMLAGLHKTLIEHEYRKMLISRPVVPLGKDIGYLPGTVEEKLHSWMLPIFDNMEFILHEAYKDFHAQGQDSYEEEDHGHKKRHKGRDKEQKKQHKNNLQPLEKLMHEGKISLEAITYMRGRSIPYQFIVIDEVQNLSPHEVKTLVSRVGEGSKIILTGDPYQIDSPYLDFISNGLVVVSERFKGQPIFGSVYLETSERSELSQLVSELF